jgi:hypothetical protein
MSFGETKRWFLVKQQEEDWREVARVLDLSR